MVTQPAGEAGASVDGGGDEREIGGDGGAAGLPPSADGVGPFGGDDVRKYLVPQTMTGPPREAREVPAAGPSATGDARGAETGPLSAGEVRPPTAPQPGSPQEHAGALPSAAPAGPAGTAHGAGVGAERDAAGGGWQGVGDTSLPALPPSPAAGAGGQAGMPLRHRPPAKRQSPHSQP